MIFNCKDDYDRHLWPLYDILDVTRGVWLNDLPVTYLDSDAGYYHLCLRNERGEYYDDPGDANQIAGESRLGKISVSLKASAVE